MPKTFLPWLRGSIELGETKEDKAAKEPAETKKESKAEAKKPASALSKLRSK